ncbi:hypothetical protein ACTXT7_009239 [Hymenolepis weldensis]
MDPKYPNKRIVESEKLSEANGSPRNASCCLFTRSLEDARTESDGNIKDEILMFQLSFFIRPKVIGNSKSLLLITPEEQ